MAQREDRPGESGSALVYILIAIALLAALTFTFMEPSSQQTTSQNTFKTLSAVESQINMIRSAIQECVLSYPKGDKTIDNSVSGTDPGAKNNYPINPNSDHYIGADVPPSGDYLVKNLKCPGNNGGTGNENEHSMVFSGASGKFLPPPPDLFDDWEYFSGTDGVFFWTKTDKSDAFLMTAMQKLDEKFSECETDIVSAYGGGVDMESSGTAHCPGGYACFRVIMVKGAGINYTTGDEDGDETAAGC